MEPSDLQQLLDNLVALPDAAIYGLLFVFAMAENVMPVLPGDTVVVFGGYLAGLGRLSLSATYVLVTLGSWAGFMVYYFIGRWLGRTRVHELVARWTKPERLERGEAWVRRYGQWVVLANRLLTGARSMISVVAGFSGLSVMVVGLLALLSCALWNVLLVGGGYYIGEEWERIVALVDTYNRVLLYLLLAALVLYTTYRLWRWRMRRNAAGSPCGLG